MASLPINFPEDSQPVLNLRLNNVPIERVKQFDFLGLTISDTLTWKDHINKLAKKIAKFIGVMNRLKYQLDKTTLLLIYNSFVLPHFYFSVLAWGFESERLLKLQKKAIRTIHRAKYNAHIKLLIKESSLLDLKDKFWHTMCKILLQIQLIFWKVFLFKTIKFTAILHEIGKISTGSQQSDHALYTIIYQP